jgi:hypothetical protein
MHLIKECQKTKQKLTEMEGEVHNSTRILRGFNIPL